MNIFSRLDVEKMLEGVLSRLDIPQIVRDVMANLIIRDLELYFVVERFHDSDDYDFLGLAYSKEAAERLASEEKDEDRVHIIRVDMGKLVGLLEKFEAAKKLGSIRNP